MNSTKQQYIETLRSDTAYPAYRGMIGIIEFLGYILAGLSALGALVSGLGAMRNSFFGGLGVLIVGLVSAVLIFFFVRFWKEASMILVDMGDSITEANSRNQSSSK